MSDPFKKHGFFSWCELMTTDVQAAKKFYGELLGWETENHQIDGGKIYTVIKADGKSVGGMLPIPPEAGGAPPHWGTYITVNDVDQVAGKALKLGATPVVPPRNIPGIGRFFMFTDPQGAIIAVISYEKKTRKKKKK